MRVALLHPEWSQPCSYCETYRLREDRTPSLRAGLPVLRQPGEQTPCHKCPKVPRSVRESGADWRECRRQAQDMTDQSRAAWAFYQRCKATGRFPDDPLVAWYSAVIAEVERFAAQVPAMKLNAGIELLTQLLLRRGR